MSSTLYIKGCLGVIYVSQHKYPQPFLSIQKKFKSLHIKKPTGAIGGIEYPPGSGTLYYRKAKHTIWNPSWNDQRIKEEMAYAFGNKVEVTRKTLNSSTGRYEIIYKSVLTDGTEVKIIFRSDDNFLNENYVGLLANMELKLE